MRGFGRSGRILGRWIAVGGESDGEGGWGARFVCNPLFSLDLDSFFGAFKARFGAFLVCFWPFHVRQCGPEECYLRG